MSSWYNYAVYVEKNKSNVIDTFENFGFTVFEDRSTVVKASINTKDINSIIEFKKQLLEYSEDITFYIELKSNDNSGSVNIQTLAVDDDGSTEIIDEKYKGENARHDYVYTYNGILLHPDKKYI